MAEIIPFRKRAAWLTIKRFVKSGRLIAPRLELPNPERPRSDTADALAYLVTGSDR